MVTTLIKNFKLSVERVPRIVALLIGIKIILPPTLDFVLLKAVDNGRSGSCDAAHRSSFAFASLAPFTRTRSHLGECYLITLRLSVNAKALGNLRMQAAWLREKGERHEADPRA